jgi:hypothetical protein
MVATGKMQFLAVAVRFLTDFLFWQPVAVGPNMVKKPDPTGLSNTNPNQSRPQNILTNGEHNCGPVSS